MVDVWYMVYAGCSFKRVGEGDGDGDTDGVVLLHEGVDRVVKEGVGESVSRR